MNFATLSAAEPPQMSLATFVADVTPPVGHPLQGGVGIKPVATVADPLLAHGFVLLGAGEPIVVCSVDWCGIGNDAHDRWREALAEAAGTTRARVLVSAIHQHDAPMADLEAERLVAAQQTGRVSLDLKFHEAAVQGVAEALQASLKEARPVTHIGTGQAKVERVASTRRILGADGKVEYVRGSASKAPRAGTDPEGLIDPWLKTLSFWNGDQPLASISVYATHPMSYYGQGEVSADFAGLARRRRQADDPGVLHFYANGCGGDLAPGKYNDGSPAKRVELAERLYQAWKSAWEQTKKHPLDQVGFRSIPLRLKPKDTAGFTVADLEAVLTAKTSSFDERVRVAYGLSWRKRCDADRAIDLPVIDFGSAQLLLLPGEPFVAYQLFAQQQRADSFVMTLGYGDYGPIYIPTDKAFEEGGYEPGTWSFVAPGVEQTMKEAIAKGLSQERKLSLTTDGQTQFVIVTSATPTMEQMTAAQWLAETLEQVTGAKFPIRPANAADLPETVIRIVVNPQMKSEEWRIQMEGESLTLEGGPPRGTIYAVCEFLETHVGVLRLDPFTESVPRQPTLTLPAIDRRGRPAFGIRCIYTGFPYSHSKPQGVNGSRWRVWNKETTYANPAVGDYPRIVPDGVHTFGRFISAKEFGASHPEYFSMDADGKRMTDDMGQPALWTQLCVTNSDVRRIVLERARQMLREDRAEAEKNSRAPAVLLCLSQNDNTSNLCLCPECKAVSDREESESGPLLEFVNFVARGLKDEFPGVAVQTEAYNFTLMPPRTIRAEPNVMVRYCDNYGLSDMTRPLADPRNAERLALLDGWAGRARQLGVWDYWRTIENAPPGLLAPSSNIRAIARDVPLFHQRGVTYLTVEVEDYMGMGGFMKTWGSNDLQSFLPLRVWLGMKLADDPARDLEATLAKFFQGYYGPAAQPMRELLDRIEDRQETVGVNSSDRRRHVWMDALCDATFFVEADRCLDSAMTAAANDPAVKARIGRERIVIDSAYLWREGAVRRKDVAAAAKLPARADVLARHREDWAAYVGSIYDPEGQELALKIVDHGLQLISKLSAEETDPLRTAVATSDDIVVLDGKLNEPCWQQTNTQRLLPRDPVAPNEDATAIRYAWSPEALYVAIEQPADRASAFWEVALMAPDRLGLQQTLIGQPSSVLSPYHYSYPAAGGMVAVPGRKSQGKLASANDQQTVVAEFRIPWSDISAEAKPGDEFLINVGSYPKPDSKAVTHVSSPWLIGDAPTYNPAYFGTVRLDRPSNLK